jgi:peptidoglycan lytic transglycosylase
MSRVGRWIVYGLALALAACGSPSRRDETTSTAPQGGGYYKDDGPGDVVPANLADIPDAVPRVEPLNRYANRPYEVFGKRYVPLTRVQPYHEQGMASWYGRRYHAKNTSSGETYDMYAMSAAHPTLPIPSYARVTNVSNGRSVVVRINDRGPFLGGRVIDLSYAAAYKLGYIGNGSARVDVDAIVPGEPVQVTRAAAVQASSTDSVQAVQATNTGSVETVQAPAGIYLQLAAFSAQASAESMRERLARELEWLAARIYVVSNGDLYKLQLGPYASRDDAAGVAQRIARELNFQPFVVVR